VVTANRPLSAWNLVRFLRKLADQGQAILCTIHQPSSLLFESFDRLLLLEKGGKTVYFGDIGEDSKTVREYFARHGAVCPPSVNPAEYMLEAIGAGVSPRIGYRDWNDIWLESSECKRSREEINEIKAAALSKPRPQTEAVSTCASSQDRLHCRKYQFMRPLTDATSFSYQLRTVVQRNNLALWRSPNYLFSRIFLCGIISLFISLPFLQLGTNVRALQFRVFGM